MGLGTQELKDILENHRKWLAGEPGGKRADLSYANLSYADLSNANLSYADLSNADLSNANLYNANLASVKTDFFTRLMIAKNEVRGLYDALMRGKINGTSYSGECACFVGTIANIRKENYQKLGIDLRPDSDSPTERRFLAIREGSTPQSNVVADITREWIEEFAKQNDIQLPKFKLVSSDEHPEAFK